MITRELVLAIVAVAVVVLTAAVVLDAGVASANGDGVGVVGPSASAAEAVAARAVLGDVGQSRAVQEPQCDVSGTKTAWPDTVMLGEDVAVELTLRFDCPQVLPDVDIVLAIDRSLSMRGEPLASAAAAARAFIAGLEEPMHRVAVVSFADDVTIDAEMYHGLGRAAQSLDWLVADGRTNLAGGIDAAAEVLRQDSRLEARHVVILLTDGVDTVGSDPVAAADALKSSGVELYCIGLGFVDHEMLSNIASTPEMYYHAPTPAELESIYLSLVAPVTAPPEGEVVLRDKLSDDVDYLVGSVAPPAAINGAEITWAVGDRPAATARFTYRVRPRRTGLIPVNDVAQAEYTDIDDVLRIYTYPVPHVRVIAPTPTPSPTPRVFTLHLPIMRKHDCVLKNVPVDAVLVMDTSGSMWGEGDDPDKMRAAKDGAHILVDILRLPFDRAALVSFNSGAQEVVPLTGERQRLHDGIDLLYPDGETAMDLGLQVGLEVLADAADEDDRHQVLVLLSDGIPNDERSAMRAAEEVKSAGVMLVTIGFGADADLVFLEAAASDGAFFYAPSRDELLKIYEHIGHALVCR
jgi:Mg-chelatase subunit ChlD